MSMKTIIGGFLFLAFWLFISWLGSWQELSRLFATYKEIDHQIKYGTVHMSFQHSDHEYDNTVHVGYSEQGIFLDSIFIFSFKSPPLLFPWQSIKSCEEREKWIKLELKQTPVRILIYDAEGLIKKQCAIKRKLS